MLLALEENKTNGGQWRGRDRIFRREAAFLLPGFLEAFLSNTRNHMKYIYQSSSGPKERGEGRPEREKVGMMGRGWLVTPPWLARKNKGRSGINEADLIQKTPQIEAMRRRRGQRGGGRGGEGD